MYLKYSGFPDYKLEFPINWIVNPFNNLNWQHHFCSLRWIEDLSLEDSLEIIKDFYNFHVIEGIQNPFFSEKKGDHTMSIRLKIVFDLYKKYILKGDSAGKEFCISLLKSDLNNLLNDSNYSYGHNHGLMLDLALLYCTEDEFLASFIDVNKVVNRADKTLHEMFSVEGFTREHSIVYQVFNSALANEFFYYAEKYYNKKLMNFIKKINESTYHLLLFSVKKGGDFFCVGDSFRIINKDLINKALANYTGCKEISYANEHHDTYLSTDVGLFFYSYNTIDLAFHMVFTSGWHSSGHKQNDDLSFCFDINGVNILDDVGYTEFVEYRNREWHRSENVHSNFSILGENWLRVDQPNKGSNITNFINEPEQLYVRAEHKRFSDEKSTRELFFDKKNKMLWVSDFHLRKSIKPNGEVETRFILNPNLEVYYRKQDIVLINHGHSVLLCLKTNSSNAVWSDEIVNYVEKNRTKISTTRVLKCRSPLDNDLLHSVVFSFKIYTKNYDKKLSIGENIIENNIWHTPNFGNIFLGSIYRESWNIDPFNNRSWVWLYQQLSFVKDLLIYDQKHKSTKGLNLSLDIIKDWGNYHNDVDFKDRVVWHDHGAAIRLRRLLDVKDVLTQKKIWNEDRYSWLNNLIKKHIFFLKDDKYYSRGNNHGLDQSTTLFLALMHYRNESWFIEYLSEANSRLRFEMQRMFDSEGGHFENSPAYQALGISQLIVINNLLKKFEKYSFDVDSNILIDRATMILAYMITPQGLYAPVGDTEAILPVNVFPNHSLPETYKHYLFAISKGKEGVAPLNKSLVLPDSGWAFYRAEWKNENDFYLLAKSGFNSGYHRQDDDTSFILCYKNESWLTDGGLYNYHENDPDRVFIRSHLAHSLTSPVVGKVIRNLNSGCEKTTMTHEYDNEFAFNILMSTGIFEGYILNREIKVKCDNNFFVLDKIVSKDSVFNNKLFRTRFIVPSDKKIEIDERSIKIFGKKSILKIELISDIRSRIEVENINISEKFNVLVEAFAVDFIFEIKESQEISYYCSWDK